jgi:transposase-like protein
MRTRRKFTAEFKAKVAIEALKERESITALSKKYQLSSLLINKWKKDFKTNAALIFTTKVTTNGLEEKEKQRLYEIIGQQKVEIDFLKKALS